MPAPKGRKAHAFCNVKGRMPSDHPCAGRCECPGRFNIQDRWWCRECAPKTVHLNCTHSLGIIGQPCPFCTETV